MSASQNPVLFGRGKKQSYINLSNKDSNTFYFLYDTRELYQGDSLYTEPVRFYTGELPTVCATGVLYFNEETGIGNVFDGNSWRTIISQNTSGTDDYNALDNTPISNLEGNPVILNSLESGVYSINGTWAVADGSDVFDSSVDSLFYIKKVDDVLKVTRISSEGVSTINYEESADPDDITYDSIPILSEIVETVKKEFWGEI